MLPRHVEHVQEEILGMTVVKKLHDQVSSYLSAALESVLLGGDHDLQLGRGLLQVRILLIRSMIQIRDS